MSEGQKEPGTVEGAIDRTKNVSWEDVKKSGQKAESPKAPEATNTSTEAPKEAEKKEEAPQEPKPESKADELDYKAELDRYKEKLEREKRTREYERGERKRLEKRVDELETTPKTGETISEETPSVEEIVERKLETIRRDERADVIEDEIASLTDNPYEQELVRSVYENEVRPSGWSRKAIKEDLVKALLWANRSKLEETALKNAKRKIAKDQATTKAVEASASTTGSVGREPPQSTPSYSQQEQRWLSRVGKTKVDGE